MKKKKEVIIIISAILFAIALFVRMSQTFQLILMLVAYILLGKDTVLKAVKNVEKGDFFDENFLMTVATLGAIIIGEYPEAVAVMLFYEVGELFQSYAINKSRKSIADMMDIKPEYANVIRDNKSIKVDPDEVQIDEIIEIKPGERVPLDAIIIKGETTLDTSALTGESIPVEVREGASILSGCINLNALILAKVTKEYFDSTVNKVLDLVENAAAKKSTSERLITRFAKIYTPIVISLAVLLAILPPIISGEYNFRLWIFRALSFLVVSCPCAFVISVPLSFFSGIGAASRAGILIKGGNYLEILSKVDTVVLDKTGTLTKGIPAVTDIVTYGRNENELITITSAIEKGSQHPLASAIMRKAEENGLKFNDVTVEDFQSITGKGVKAKINNEMYYVGSQNLFEELHGSISSDKKEKIADMQTQGKTVMVLGTEKEILSFIAVADEMRESSKEVIGKLNNMGIETVMLTGDNQRTATAIGKQVGVSDIKADLLPEDKLNFIKELREKHQSVGMVGDGVNDAPALAASTVGVAMGGAGTDTALETADIALMSDDLSKLPYTIKLSRKALAIIKQNITFSLAIKLVALLLVMPGWLTLWIAIFADMGATLLVTLNSLRLLKIKE